MRRLAHRATVSRDSPRSDVERILDGALPDAIQERVAEHLAECSACSSHFDFARTFLAAVRQYGCPGIALDSADLRARVLEALQSADERAS
jgi:predicted anti-sigma-YlaC factor YlaD